MIRHYSYWIDCNYESETVELIKAEHYKNAGEKIIFSSIEEVEKSNLGNTIKNIIIRNLKYFKKGEK